MRSKTIQHTGGAPDYTSIALWEASIADTDDETGTQTSAEAQDTAPVTLNATSTGHVYLLTADSGSAVSAATRANANAKTRIDVGAGGTALTIASAGFVVEKTSFRSTNDRALRIEASTTIRRAGLFGQDKAISVASGTSTASNCFGVGGDIGVITDTGSTITLYQCSFIMPSGNRAAYASGGTIVVLGCVSQGTAGVSDFWVLGGVFTGSNYNVTQDASAVGANSLTSQSGAFTDMTTNSEDFALTSASTYAIVNRSGFPSDTDTDVVGTTRPSTGADAGAWQNVAASGMLRRFNWLGGIGRPIQSLTGGIHG